MKKKLLFLLMGLPVLVPAAIPCGSCTVYGLVKDSYGHPYLDSARISFVNTDGETAAWADITGLVGYGYNFQLALDLDNGSGERYADYAVREGEQVTISVLVDGVEEPLLEGATFTVPAPGADVALTLTTGTDADGDGIPDEWERQMMAASGGSITNISQILPDGDFDGDGASNWQEYLSGTFAFLDYDCFAIRDLERTDDGRFLFRFLSVEGKSYSVDVAAGLGDDDSWGTGLFSLSEDGELSQSVTVGDGYYKTMYIEMSGAQQFMRLRAE